MLDHKTAALDVMNFLKKCEASTSNVFSNGILYGKTFCKEYHEMLSSGNCVLLSFPEKILKRIERHLDALWECDGLIESLKQLHIYKRHLVKVQTLTKNAYYRYY